MTHIPIDIHNNNGKKEIDDDFLIKCTRLEITRNFIQSSDIIALSRGLFMYASDSIRMEYRFLV